MNGCHLFITAALITCAFAGESAEANSEGNCLTQALAEAEIPLFKNTPGFTDKAIHFGSAHRNNPQLREKVAARWENAKARGAQLTNKFRDKSLAPEEKKKARDELMTVASEAQYYHEMLQAMDGVLR